MAFERGDAWLSYEVWKVDFYPQVAWKNLLWPFTLFSPRNLLGVLSFQLFRFSAGTATYA